MAPGSHPPHELHPARRTAYRAADWIARLLTSQGAFPGLGPNLAAIYGHSLSAAELNQRKYASVCNALRCYVDLLAIAAGGERAVDEAFTLELEGLESMTHHRRHGRGVVFVGAHMSSFDVLLLALSRQVTSMQLISKPHPGLNTRLLNRIRAQHGLRVTPLSTAALREAISRLRAGGVVGLAADVPAHGGAPLTFFGRPCWLAIGHARLALSTDAAMVVGVSQRLGAGQYRGLGVDCPRPASCGDRQDQAVQWSQSAIGILERYIAERPEEWFLPPALWPTHAPSISRPQLRAAQPRSSA